MCKWPKYGEQNAPSVEGLDLRVKRSGFENWPGQSVVFLGKMCNSHSSLCQRANT